MEYKDSCSRYSESIPTKTALIFGTRDVCYWDLKLSTSALARSLLSFRLQPRQPITAPLRLQRRRGRSSPQSIHEQPVATGCRSVVECVIEPSEGLTSFSSFLKFSTSLLLTFLHPHP